MKVRYYLYVILTLLLTNITYVHAECTDEEINKLKEETDKVEITYKHLGEVTKSDGTKVYNEFEVTAKNIPDNVFIHLYPTTEEDFVVTEDEVKIKLTTGEWKYHLYSVKCDIVIDTIEIKLPRFNEYSLDSLCEGIDDDDFKLCGKYYETEIDRETFERRINAYLLQSKYNEVEEEKQKIKTNFFNKALDFIENNLLYITIILGIIVVTIISVITIRKRKKRSVLQ